MRIRVLSLILILSLLIGCGSYDKGYEDGYDGRKKNIFSMFSKSYKRGYERGADDAWMFDKGAYDKAYRSGPDSSLKDDPDYRDGFNSN